MTNEETGGGSLAFHTIVPLVDPEVDIAPGVSDTDSGKGWFISAKYSHEMALRNRAEGDALWIKAVMPF